MDALDECQVDVVSHPVSSTLEVTDTALNGHADFSTADHLHGHGFLHG